MGLPGYVPAIYDIQPPLSRKKAVLRLK